MFEYLRNDADGEPGNAFTKSKINKAIRELDEDSEEYPYVKLVKNLEDKKTRLNREIRNAYEDLDKAVEEQIPELSDDQINELVYEKWFSHQFKIVKLIDDPLKEEVDTIKPLNDRYAETLDDLDEQIT